MKTFTDFIKIILILGLFVLPHFSFAIINEPEAIMHNSLQQKEIISSSNSNATVLPPANDLCADAIAISCGQSYIGTTIEATTTGAPIEVCGTTPQAGGVWYKITGDGSVMTLSTCSPSTNYDTRINVYTDGCGTLSCVTGDDDDSSCSESSRHSTATFETENDVEYLVYVNGFSSAVGDFELSVDCYPIEINDLCTAAIEISCGGSYIGTTLGATSTGTPTESCETNLGDRGVWYKVTGDGSSIRLSTCNANTDYNTKIHVYTDGCDVLTCVTGNDDDNDCIENDKHSTVTFQSLSDVEYLVYVNGLSGAGGNFELSVDCTLPLNDLCTAAIEISCGQSYTGSTVATTSTGAVSGECGSTSAQAPGVWYKIIGTGGEISINTCSDVTDYDIGLIVYTGGCNTLNCIAGGDFGAVGGTCTDDLQHITVSFISEPGIEYFIYVNGFGIEVGNFELNIDCDPPSNDLCVDAIEVACGQSYLGSTVTATTTGEATNFCGTSLVSGGIWYKIVGDGSSMRLSTCSPSTNYDTQINVYTDGCGVLSCVTSDDDDSSCSESSRHSTATFETENDVEYLVYVSGFFGLGNFALSVDCYPTPANDLCADAVEMTCGQSYIGTTLGASSIGESTRFCGTGLGDGGVWYKITGDGSSITLSTCGISTDYDTKIHVYTDGCGTLSCLADNDNDDDCRESNTHSTLTFNALNGVEYFVYVNGFSAAAGNFELNIDCSPPPNDLCIDAIEISCGQSYIGSTVLATSTGAVSGECGSTSAQASGVWYKIIGTGGEISVNTCGDITNYDIGLIVYAGDCTALNCIDGDDLGAAGGFCTSNTRHITVTFISEPGIEYFIYVNGFNANIGNFELNVDCSPPLNDLCADAIEMTCGQSYFGSTAAATTTGISTEFCGTIPEAPGLWYQITGDNTTMRLSTCNVSTDYDTKINVYMDGCDILSCVTGNDQDASCSENTDYSTVTFQAENGVEYLVYVNGYFGAVGNFELTCGAPLAIDLLSFQGEIRANTNYLSWTIQNEYNTDLHIVERKENNREADFVSIGQVPAKKNSQVSNQYEWKDIRPLTEAYYRIKTRHDDGSLDVSKVMLLQRKPILKPMKLYPVPVSNELTVELTLTELENIQIEIFNINGQKVQQNNYSFFVNESSLMIDVNKLNNGFYVLSAFNSNQKIGQERFIIHRP